MAEVKPWAPTPFSRLKAVQCTDHLPSAASSSGVTSQQQPVMVPSTPTPRVRWQSPEENVHPSREELFFQGQPTTLGALQIPIGLLHVSCGGILAASPNSVEFPTTYWYLLAGGMLFFISGAVTLVISANCTVCRLLQPGPHCNHQVAPDLIGWMQTQMAFTLLDSWMEVSTGLNVASSLCASLGVCALAVELAGSSRFAPVPQKSLLVVLLVFTVLELGIACSSAFLGCHATFCYTWLYLNPAEDVPMATAASPESTPWWVQQPPATI